jgi:hypothetical protein
MSRLVIAAIAACVLASAVVQAGTVATPPCAVTAFNTAASIASPYLPIGCRNCGVSSAGAATRAILSFCNSTSNTPQNTTNCPFRPYYVATFQPRDSGTACVSSYGNIVSGPTSPIGASTSGNFTITFSSAQDTNVQLIVNFGCDARGTSNNLIYSGPFNVSSTLARLFIGDANLCGSGASSTTTTTVSGGGNSGRDADRSIGDGGIAGVVIGSVVFVVVLAVLVYYLYKVCNPQQTKNEGRDANMRAGTSAVEGTHAAV